MRTRPLGTGLRTAIVLAFALASSGAARADAEADRWIAWHRAFALRLEAEGRTYEAAEEWTALALLAKSDPRPVIRAAVALVDATCEPGSAPTKTDKVYQRAEQLIREAVRRGGLHDPGLDYAIGRLRYVDGDYETAQNMLGLARQRGFDPIRARLWHYRAVIADSPRLVEEASSDEAVRRLERVLKDFPDHPEFLVARISLAIAHRRRGEHVVAEQILNDVINVAPWAARAHLALAEVYSDLSRWDEAAGEYRAAMDRAQERDDGVYTGRAVYQEAVRSEAWTNLRRGDLDACEARAKQVLAMEPELPDTYYLLGSLSLSRGMPDDLKEAVRLLRRAARLAPDRREIMAPLIAALTQLGETEEAEELTRKLTRAQEEARLKSEEKYRRANRGAAAPK